MHEQRPNLRQETAHKASSSFGRHPQRLISQFRSICTLTDSTWIRMREGCSAKSVHVNANSSVLLAVHNYTRSPTKKSNLALSDHIWGFRKRVDRRQVTSRLELRKTWECHVPRTEPCKLPEAHHGRGALCSLAPVLQGASRMSWARDDHV